MNFRKLKFQGNHRHQIQSEEMLLYELLKKLPSSQKHSNTIFEDSMSFYGYWETSLYFFDFLSGQILHYEEIGECNLKTFKEYNTNDSFKSYKFLSFNHELLSPIYSFFHFDTDKKIYFNSFVYDTENPLLNLDFFKQQGVFSVPSSDIEEKIKEQHINLNKYNSHPFLFIKK